MILHPRSNRNSWATQVIRWNRLSKARSGSIPKSIGGLLIVACLTNSLPAANERIDVSQIITKGEAAAILEEPVKEPSARNGDGAEGYYSKCNYYSVNRGKSLVVRLQLPGPNAIGPQKELQLVAAANGASEKVTGVGDAAQMFAAGGESGFASRILLLYVAKGSAFMTIGVGGFVDDAVALEKAKAVAQKLIEHL